MGTRGRGGLHPGAELHECARAPLGRLTRQSQQHLAPACLPNAAQALPVDSPKAKATVQTPIAGRNRCQGNHAGKDHPGRPALPLPQPLPGSGRLGHAEWTPAGGHPPTRSLLEGRGGQAVSKAPAPRSHPGQGLSWDPGQGRLWLGRPCSSTGSQGPGPAPEMSVSPGRRARAAGVYGGSSHHDQGLKLRQGQDMQDLEPAEPGQRGEDASTVGPRPTRPGQQGCAHQVTSSR